MSLSWRLGRLNARKNDRITCTKCSLITIIGFDSFATKVEDLKVFITNGHDYYETSSMNEGRGITYIDN